MPLHQHEAIADLLRESPTLISELLARVGFDLPKDVTVLRVEADLSDAIPAEYRADGLVLKEGAETISALVLEVQLRRDEEKRWTWPSYLTLTRRRHHCETDVLVVTTNAQTARWAGQRLRLGRRNFFEPLVIGPAEIPRVESEEEVRRHPALAVLSALTHVEESDLPVQLAVARALPASPLEGDKFPYYVDVIRSQLSESLRQALEAAMPVPADYVPTDPYAKALYDAVRKGKAEGKAEGLQNGLRTILTSRGFTLTSDQEQRIRDCSDPERLTGWLARAATAIDVEHVLSDAH